MLSHCGIYLDYFRLVEKGRAKCGTYWPQQVNTMETYGDFNVMSMEVDMHTEGDHQITTLCVCNKKVGLIWTVG